ncbi:hypothetical protein C0J52_03787 [Blattella germanica]|nr:hypothetical protein C0J52_03787 [Blattella germanica]
MENLLRKMATTNKIEQRNKIKQLRISLINHLRQDKKTFKTFWSYTHKGQLLNDILKAVKKRHSIFNCWLDRHPEHFHLQRVVILQKQAMKLMNDIMELTRKLDSIQHQNKELSALKKSIDEVSKFFHENKDALNYWFIKESPSLTAITQYFPERKELINTTNVKEVVNIFKNSNYTQCIHVPLHCKCKRSDQGDTKDESSCNNNAQGIVRNYSKKCIRTTRKGMKSVLPPAIDQQAGFNFNIKYITKTKRKKIPIVAKTNNPENSNEDESSAPKSLKRNKSKKVSSQVRKPRLTKKGNKHTSKSNELVNKEKPQNKSIGKSIENRSTPTLEDSSSDVSKLLNEYKVPTPVSNIGTESNLSLISKYPGNYKNQHDFENVVDTESENRDFINNYSQCSRFTPMTHKLSRITAEDFNNDRHEQRMEDNQFIVPDFIPETVTNALENEMNYSKLIFNNEKDLIRYKNLNAERPYQHFLCPSQYNSVDDTIYSTEDNSTHSHNSPWPSTDLPPNFSTWNMPENNWEEGISACTIPSNETITESRAWVYKQNNLPAQQMRFSTGTQLSKLPPNHISCSLSNVQEIQK